MSQKYIVKAKQVCREPNLAFKNLIYERLTQNTAIEDGGGGDNATWKMGADNAAWGI